MDVTRSKQLHERGTKSLVLEPFTRTAGKIGGVPAATCRRFFDGRKTGGPVNTYLIAGRRTIRVEGDDITTR